MRVVSCLVAFLAGVSGAEALTSMRHHHHRARANVASHRQLLEDLPCPAGTTRVFEPQLRCAQLSAPTEPVNLVVVTDSTCKEVLQGIKTKSPPYWDPEMERCADETRVGLLTQCAQKVGSNFSTALQSLCHFDTKVMNAAFHSVKIVPALPAVEVPTGAFVPGQLVQKRTSMSLSREKELNDNIHPDPKTPDKPIEKFADYPTDLTASAQHQAVIAQATSGCLGAGNVRVPCSSLSAGHAQVAIKSFTYSDSAPPALAATGEEPVIVAPHTNSGSVRTVSLETVVPAGAVKVASQQPAQPAVPNEKWARYPSSQVSSAAVSMAVKAQQESGVLPRAPTVLHIRT